MILGPCRCGGRDLAEPEVVSSLIDLLSTGSEEGRAYAAWAIARLAEDIGVRDKIYYTGGLPQKTSC